MKEKKDAKFRARPITGIVTPRRHQEESEGDESLSLFGKQNSVRERTEVNPEAVTLQPSPSSLTILYGVVENSVSTRVLVRLAEAESREIDAWLRDDYRIAWLTVLHCADGIADPWRFAFWKYLGQVPEKLIPFFVERAEKHRLMNVPDYDPSVRKSSLPQSASPRKKESA